MLDRGASVRARGFRLGTVCLGFLVRRLPVLDPCVMLGDVRLPRPEGRGLRVRGRLGLAPVRLRDRSDGLSPLAGRLRLLASDRRLVPECPRGRARSL